MHPAESAKLGRCLASICQEARASVNSLSTAAPFANRQTAPGARTMSAKPSSLSTDASARAEMTSCGGMSAASIRARMIRVGRPISLTAVCKNTVLRVSLSINDTHRSGESCAASAATTSPGNPAPAPRSTHVRACGGRKSHICAESRIWRSQIRGTVDFAIRLIFKVQRDTRAARISRRSPVSRETSRCCRSTASPAPLMLSADQTCAHGPKAGSTQPVSSPRCDSLDQASPA